MQVVGIELDEVGLQQNALAGDVETAFENAAHHGVREVD